MFRFDSCFKAYDIQSCVFLQGMKWDISCLQNINRNTNSLFTELHIFKLKSNLLDKCTIDLKNHFDLEKWKNNDIQKSVAILSANERLQMCQILRH